VSSLLTEFLKVFTLAGVLLRKAQRRASRWLRIILALIVTQFVLVVVASLLPYHTATTMVPIVALIPLIALAMIAYAHPLIVSALAATSMKTKFGNEFSRPLCKIIGFEVLMGIYCAMVPLSRDRGLIPLVILAWVALLFFKGFVRFILVCAIVILTLIFISGGRDSALMKKVEAAMSVAPSSANGQENAGGKRSPKGPVSREASADVVIPNPVASPRPDPQSAADAAPAPLTNSDSSLPQCSAFGLNGAPAASPPTFQYGDFAMMMVHCHPEGSQVRFSGLIQYKGSEKFILYFHKFIVKDNSGTPYEVQSGQLGQVKDLGKGYAGIWVYPQDTIAFSFIVGSKDGSAVSAASMNVVMPFNSRMGSEINFSNLILK
jgi:hypothetical protein